MGGVIFPNHKNCKLVFQCVLWHFLTVGHFRIFAKAPILRHLHYVFINSKNFLIFKKYYCSLEFFHYICLEEIFYPVLQTFLLFIPVFACCFWALIHCIFVPRTESFLPLIAFLVVLAATLFGDSCYASPRTSYAILAQTSILMQFAAPCIVPLLMLFLNKLFQHTHARAATMSWLIVSGALLAAGIIIYQIAGHEASEAFLQDFYTNGFRSVPLYRGTILFFYFLWNIVAEDVVVALELLVLVLYLHRIARRGDFRISRVWKFLFRGGKVTSLELELYVIVPVMVVLPIRASLLKGFVDSHVWLSLLGSAFLFVEVCLFSYIALFGAAKEISIKDMKRAFRYNLAPGEVSEDIQSQVAGPALPSPRPAMDAIFAPGRVFPDDDELRVRFQELMQKEKLFLSPGLTLGDVADRLSSNKTYVSRLVNSTYDMGFPELLNTLRVDYSKRFILSHRSARQDEIAKASGFLSASSFNIIFKKVTGVTPKVWLAGTSKL